MSTFDYRRNRRQQLVAKGEPVDNNISFDGKTKDFLNMFANKMKDTNNLYQSQRFPEFDDQTSDVVRQNLIGQSDGYGQFNDMEQQIKSDAFVNKFRNSLLLTDAEKRNVSAEGVLQYMQGKPKDPPVNGQFPTDGVKVS
jgi:hypothetical protein